MAIWHHLTTGSDIDKMEVSFWLQEDRCLYRTRDKTDVYPDIYICKKKKKIILSDKCTGEE